VSDQPWDIRREGRGKFFASDEERLTMLALLLENVGTGAAVRLGDPAVWRKAIADLE
jgi:hypothetical protein